MAIYFDQERPGRERMLEGCRIEDDPSSGGSNANSILPEMSSPTALKSAITRTITSGFFVNSAEEGATLHRWLHLLLDAVFSCENGDRESFL